ncbi:MAG: integrase [Globicatella sulfidifaciens]|uniref:Integrase n=1 Tax=Globicatella sulfidifaciens TaxID=136093 RepID=A0A7X8H181_9LACT|nr:integrase [Globicatella sulfidifaciens]
MSLRSIVMITQHSRQKFTEIVELAKRKGVEIPLEEEMTDPWLEDFLYPEKSKKQAEDT